MGYAPFFYQEIIDMFVDEFQSISKEEVLSAAAYLLKSRGSVCKEWVMKLTGVDFERPTADELRNY